MSGREEAAKEKIRILIVDDMAETRENMRKLLSFEPDIEVVGAAADGEDGINQCVELEPDVVLMDINMPVIDGLTACRTIKQKNPFTEIVMISVQDDSDYLRRSMLAGAREFLAKPFSSEELVNAVRQVYQLGEESRKWKGQNGNNPGNGNGNGSNNSNGNGKLPDVIAANGKLITLFSPKGGVGKSTIAINLAVALQQDSVNGRRREVAVFDSNFQFGDVAVLLNLPPRRSIVDLARNFDELGNELLSDTMTDHPSGIKALLAPNTPEQADNVVVSMINPILDRMKQRYDYVVIDTPSILNDVTLAILDASDLVILVVTSEIPAIKNAKLFVDIAAALEYPPEKLMLALNMSVQKADIKAEDIEKGLQHNIAAQIPLDSRTIQSAVNQGIPCVTSQPNSVIALAFQQMAQKIHAQLNPVSTREEAVTVQSKVVKTRFFGR